MRTYIQRLLVVILGLYLFSGAIAAENELLNPSHPDRYVVKKGDTLWDISGRFLREPWRWPDIWYANPQIENPHLIYPGDIVELSYVDGQPRLSVTRGGVVKLSPRIRTDAATNAIPTIPINAIQQFLSRPYVLNKPSLDGVPYIVSFGEEHLLGSTDTKAYVRSIESEDEIDFDVIRPGPPYQDADTGEILGYQAVYVGSAELHRTGDPATVILGGMQLEFSIGDRLIPDTETLPLGTFVPKTPDTEVRGSIIGVLNGVNQIGQYNTVVLDRGGVNGLRPGHVLAINHRGVVVRDTVAAYGGAKVKLPNEPAGVLLVYRVFDRVSFGLVMYATRALHVGDRVLNP